MRRCAVRASISSNRYIRGVTLMELMVTLVVLSILAAAALPYAELTVKRNRELELRQALREIRSAVDRFHQDWRDGRISKHNDAASEDGFPKTLEVLIEGVESAQAKGGKIKYLRRIPRDPFARADESAESQWALRGYQDDADSKIWSGKDVFDVRSMSERKAIDGTLYKDW